MKNCCPKCRREDYRANFALPMCQDISCECHFGQHRIGKHGAVMLGGQEHDICAECGKKVD